MGLKMHGCCYYLVYISYSIGFHHQDLGGGFWTFTLPSCGALGLTTGALCSQAEVSYKAIPPTRAALIEHSKLAAYQAGCTCIWSQSTVCQPETQSPADWGWIQGEVWKICWSSLNKLPRIDQMRLQEGMSWQLQMLGHQY